MADLGDKVKDPITEYKGIAYARTTYMQGCDRIGIQAPINEEGQVPELFWVDEPQLIITSKVKKKSKNEKGKGGPSGYGPSNKL